MECSVGCGCDSPAADGYELVWSDEFDGTSLDTARWNARDNTWVDYDLACITSDADNLLVEDGVLVLRARREQDTCGSATRDYTVAYLDTIGKASFTYGRFEIRANPADFEVDHVRVWQR